MTIEQKMSQTEYRAIINKYKGRDLARLPRATRDSFIIATAKDARFPNSLKNAMSDIEKTPEGSFLFNKRFYAEPVYTVTFYKDKEKNLLGWTVYVSEKVDEVLN